MILAGAVALLATGVAVQAQELQGFDQVAGWDVLVDPTLDNGCLINAEFEDGSDVRIGFDMRGPTGYIHAANDGWGDIVEGQSYPVSFSLDGEVYQGEGEGLYIDGLPGVDIEFDSIDFLMDIAQKQTMELSSESGPVMTIDLTGSAVALARAVECQDAQG